MLELCTNENLEEWLALRQSLYTGSDISELLTETKDFLAAPEKYCQYIVRSHNGEAIAFVEASIRTDYVNGSSTSPVVYLESIFVKEAYRRREIAKSMVDAIVLWAKSKGIDEIISDADLSNTTSQAMHTALGFKEMERVVFFKKEIEK